MSGWDLGDRPIHNGEDIGRAKETVELMLHSRETRMENGTLACVLELLGNADPSFRQLALHALCVMSRETVQLLEGNQDTQQLMVDAVSSVVVGDETMWNRYLGCLALGRCLEGFTNLDLREQIIAICAPASFQLFSQAFSFEDLNICVHAVNAYGCFMEYGNPIDREARLIKWRHEALRVITSTNVRVDPKAPLKSDLTHPLLLVNILKVMRENLADTPKRRMDIIYPIIPFINQLFVAEGRDGQLSNRGDIHSSVYEEASWFLCRWYTVPTDEILLSIGPNPSAVFSQEMREGSTQFLPRPSDKTVNDINGVQELVDRKRRRDADGAAGNEELIDASYLSQGGYVLRKSKLLVEVRRGKETQVIGKKRNSARTKRRQMTTKKQVSITVADIQSHLTFNIRCNSIEFSGPQPTLSVRLTNRALKGSEHFSLQTYPSNFFYAVPAHGVVKAGSSLPITLHFVPHLNDQSIASTTINGFLRVRTKFGFCGERIDLSACNGPLLHIFDSTIDFGYVALSIGMRKLPLYIQNVSPVPCNCTILSKGNMGAFRSETSHCLILPGQTFQADIIFSPKEETQYSETITVAGVSGEVHQIALFGHGGQPLAVLDEQLDFGPVDVSPSKGEYMKLLHLRNHDLNSPLVCHMETSHPKEIFVESITLNPGESRGIPVEINPLHDGLFQGSIMIFAPQSRPVNVPVEAFVGNIIGFPLYKEIFLPLQNIDYQKKFSLPISNFIDEAIEFRLRWDRRDISFTLQTYEKGIVSLDNKTPGFLDAKTSGVVTAVSGVSSRRAFRVPIYIEVQKPKQCVLGPWYLTAGFVDYYLEGPRNHLSFGQLHSILLGEEKAKDEMDGEEKTNYIMTGGKQSLNSRARAVFTLSKEKIHMHSFASKRRQHSATSSVELRNITDEPQEYVLLVSHPFTTSAPVRGEIDPHDTLTIQLNLKKVDPPNATYAGSLSVVQGVDEKRRIAASAQIFASNTPVVDIVYEDGVFDIHGVSIGQTERRSVKLVNKCGEIVKCAALLNQSTASSPFRFANGNGDGCLLEFELEPWQSVDIAVEFSPKVAGAFASTIQITCVDPLENSNKGNDDEITWASVLSSMVTGSSCDEQSIALEPNLILDFGDVTVGRKVTGTVYLRNKSPYQVPVSTSTAAPFSIAPNHHYLTLQKPQAGSAEAEPGTVSLPISFRPTVPGNFLKFFAVSIARDPSKIAVVGLKARSGMSKCTSNLGEPSRIEYASPDPAIERPTIEQTDNAVNFGYVDTVKGVSKEKLLIIKNTGTRSITVKEIKTSGEGLKWDVLTNDDDLTSKRHVHGISQNTLEQSLRATRKEQEMINKEGKISQELLGFMVRQKAPLCMLEEHSSREGTDLYIDWDEFDYQLYKEAKQCRASFNTKRASIVSSTRTTTKRGRLSRILNQQTVNEVQRLDPNQKDEDMLVLQESLIEDKFPVVLERGKAFKIKIELDYSHDSVGEFCEELQLCCEDTGAPADCLISYRCLAQFQPPLEWKNDPLNFGLVALENTAVLHTSFRNVGIVQARWKLNVSTCNTFEADDDDKNDSIDCDVCPFTLYPPSGVLDPGRTQRVKVIFRCEMQTSAYLNIDAQITLQSGINMSEDLIEKQGNLDDEDFDVLTQQGELEVSACTGSAILLPTLSEQEAQTFLDENMEDLSVNKLSVPFNSIRVGNSKTITVHLVNTGNMDACFTIQRTDSMDNQNRFHVFPTEGVIKSGLEAPLKCKFEAIDEKVCATNICVSWCTKDELYGKGEEGISTPKEINLYLSGRSGYPALEVKEGHLDFGWAILNVENTAKLRLWNTGNAEATAEFHPSLSTVYVKDENCKAKVSSVSVPARSCTDVFVTFRPNKICQLDDVPLIIKSPDSSQGWFDVRLYAKVGAPKLSITPDQALAKLDYQVALINQRHIRSFTVTNLGNVGLEFNCKFLRPTERAFARVKKRRGRSQDLTDEMIDQLPWDDLFPSLTKGDYEEFTPKYFSIEPMRGVFLPGERVHFTVVYEPKQRAVETRALLVLDNKFSPIKAEVRGIGGDPLLELDDPSKVIDFGVCEENQKYTRVLHALNMGNVSYMFGVFPDPADLALRTKMMDAGWNGERGQRGRAIMYQGNYIPEKKADIGNELHYFKIALETMGFSIETTGACEPFGRAKIKIRFSPPESSTPLERQVYTVKVHILHNTGYEKLAIRACMGRPSLKIVDINQEPLEGNLLDFGVNAINTSITRTIVIHNSGNVGALFYIDHKLPVAFKAFPMEGLIKPGMYLPLEITFSPTSLVPQHCVLRLLYNGSRTVDVKIAGVGGCGVLEVEFLSERETAQNGLDFELVATGVLREKVLLVHNKGQVGLDLVAESMASFFILGEILPKDIQKATPGYLKRASECLPPVEAGGLSSMYLMNGHFQVEERRPKVSQKPDPRPIVTCHLPPGEFVKLKVMLYPNRERMYVGLLKLKSQFNSAAIPLHGRGGIVKLVHHGDLDFGDIACDHPYTRTITLSNLGSIPSSVKLSWIMAPGSREAFSMAEKGNQDNSTVLLCGTSTSLGRRRLWQWAIEAVLSYTRERKRKMLFGQGFDQEANSTIIGTYKRTKARKHELKEDYLSNAAGDKDHLMNDAAVALTTMGQDMGAKLNYIIEGFQHYQEEQLETQTQQLGQLIEEEEKRLSSGVLGVMEKHESENVISSLRRYMEMTAEVPIDILDDDEHVQDANELELEQSGFALAHVRVVPKQGTISKRISMDVTVSLNCPKIGEFSATLAVIPVLAGISPYDIPLTANAKEVRILVDDRSVINFGRQSRGECKTITRTFFNKGTMTANFKIKNNNSDIAVEPPEGVLPAGESVLVEFTFTPTSEDMCTHPIVFETDCTAPIVLELYAGGGYPQVDLDSYDRIDFGRCMVGKSISKGFRIGNTGNAVLNITGFKLHEPRGGNGFEHGVAWPHNIDRLNPLKILPGNNYHLPLTFHPNCEDRFETQLTIHTMTGSYTIGLIGTGREAVISLSLNQVDFMNCICGNAYQRTFEVTNAGDLEYPVETKLGLSIQGGAGTSPTDETSNPTDEDESNIDEQQNFPIGSGDWNILDDLKIEPERFSIAPFETKAMTITYVPTRPFSDPSESRVTVSLSSIYSSFEIPVVMQSGTAQLDVTPPNIDFGHFEQSKSKSAVLSLANHGTVALSFRIKRTTDNPFPFRISRWEGTLAPGDAMELTATYVANSGEEQIFGDFSEEMLVETDVVGSVHYFNIIGRCDACTLDVAQFTTIKLGPCTVGETITKSVEINNYGGYPADVTFAPSYPIKVTPRTLTIPGKGVGVLQVQWKPMGAYEMHANISINTNIGTFDSDVYGAGVYPKFKLEGSRIDFGVCAPGFNYEKQFVVCNIGKVPMSWSIPAVADSYVVIPSSGSLQPRERGVVTVKFRPLDIGKYPGDFIVESKSIYKIVSCNGLGGRFDFRITPKEVLRIGKIPCGTSSTRGILLENRGGVTIHLDVEKQPSPIEWEVVSSCFVRKPASAGCVYSCVLLPGSEIEMKFLVNPGDMPGPFSFGLVFRSRETSERYTVSGLGQVIRLKDETKQLLSKEELPCLMAPALDNSCTDIALGQVTRPIELFHSSYLEAIRQDLLLQPRISCGIDLPQPLVLPPLPIREETKARDSGEAKKSVHLL